MVATFHIWFGKVSGGVDVFLLVSAYLMTRSLALRSEGGSITRPVSYLIKKFSRLLPAAAVTIALITVGVFAFLPANHWQGSLSDALGSLFYFENMRLQDATVDYFAADRSSASPFQHFWSLSVQGQVFILFALLHLIGDAGARYLGFPVRKMLLGMFSVLAVGSFAYSVWLTDQNQAYAYFDTAARVWEFAVGSVLALVQPWLRVPWIVRSCASWLGIVAMLACGFVLPVESSFPGWAALWPVSAAALVIISAGAPTRFGADRILAHGALNKLGGYTYALYLTHWPVLVLFLWAVGLERVNWWQGLLILGVSGALSFVIARCFERPVAAWLKRDRPARKRWLPRTGWRSPVAILLSIVLVVGVVGAGTMRLTQQLRQDRAAIEALRVSEAGANAPGMTSRDTGPLPAVSLVTSDWVSAGQDCAADDPFLTELCYEIPAVEGEAERVVYAIGSSHSTQFNAALLEAVNRHPGWGFRTQVSPGCYYMSREGVGPECVDLWDRAAAYIATQQPDLVVLFGTQTYHEFEMTQPDLVDWIDDARHSYPGTRFVAMRDNPRIPTSLFECATRFGYDSDDCAFRYETSTDPAYIAALEEVGVIWVDLNGFICPDRECRPSQGGVVTYLDESHLTGTYVRTLAQKFSNAIVPAVDWWPRRVYEEGAFTDRARGNDVLEDLNR
ncbi:acyltransferase [Leucobacter ruminantium]|uniref:Acyltransferase n=2 Tax=Leucobacter ruminantium TaxID=1289170 RepID=A0A939RZJ4_9MICO|nr:acyltransferase family protein [Leucobacter ruminantium]MBO1805554.1 acyltransferase [Leucobacter ruminantium]